MSSIPILFWVALIVAIVAAVLVVRWVRDANRRTAERMLADFMHMFPGRCPLCSYHRHALQHGADFPLGPHVCLEGNSPPAPIDDKARTWTRLA